MPESPATSFKINKTLLVQLTTSSLVFFFYFIFHFEACLFTARAPIEAPASLMHAR